MLSLHCSLSFFVSLLVSIEKKKHKFLYARVRNKVWLNINYNAFSPLAAPRALHRGWPRQIACKWTFWAASVMNVVRPHQTDCKQWLRVPSNDKINIYFKYYNSFGNRFYFATFCSEFRVNIAHKCSAPFACIHYERVFERLRLKSLHFLV